MTPSGEQEDVTEWEEVSAAQKFIKEVVSGIYEELQVAKRKGRQSTDNWAEGLSGHFAEEAVQDGRDHSVIPHHASVWLACSRRHGRAALPFLGLFSSHVPSS